MKLVPASTMTRLLPVAILGLLAVSCSDRSNPTAAPLSLVPGSVTSAVTLEPIFSERFTRSTGKPEEFLREISTTRYESPFSLRIRSGDELGEHRVSSASVSLDGVELLRPSDFNQQASEWTIEVQPKALSTLAVTLASAPGSFLDIRLEGKRAATLFCPDGRDGAVTDIRQAINRTDAGGTVAICDGTHIVRGVGILKALTIEAAGPGVPVLDPGAPGNVFFAQNPAGGAITLRNLEMLARGATSLFMSEANDRVVVDNVVFRMIPVPGFPPNTSQGAGGTGIFVRQFPGTPPVTPTAVLEVRNSAFHGGFRSVDIGNSIARAEISGNTFEHAQAAGMAIGVAPGGRVIATHNVFNGCGDQCFGGGANTELDFHDNQVTVLLSAPAGAVVTAGDAGSVIRMSRNTITGVGRDLANPDPGKRYPISVAIQTSNGGTISGSDNRISGANFLVNAFGTLAMNRNDFTEFGSAINGAAVASNLRCNWWGSAAGPANVPPHISGSVYAPWATQPIAGTTVPCDPDASLLTVRVCSVSGSSFTVPTAALAMAIVESGGTILFCDGTHTVQNLDVRKSVTFAAEGPGMPTLDGGAANDMLRSFDQPVDIVVRGLRFRDAREHMIHFNSSRSLRVEDSEFHPFQTFAYQTSTAGYQENWMSGVGVFGSPGSVLVQRSTFVGGDIGVHVNTGCCTPDGTGSGSIVAQNNTFTGQSNAGFFVGGSSPATTVAVESNSFAQCGRFGCSKFFSGTGGSVTYRNNRFDVDIARPVFSPINVTVFPFGGTAAFEGNTILGTGGSGDRMAQSTYPIDGFAIQFAGTSASFTGNTIRNAWVAVNVTPGDVTGRDNVISHVSTVLFGGGAPLSSRATFQRNDITDYMQMLLNSGIFASVDLRCNWWGSASGPAVTGPGTNPSMYTPFATAPIANQPTVCTP